MYRTVVLLLAATFSPAVVSAQQPCTTDARQVVDELYRHMLERPAGDASAQWVEQLESGRMDVREVVRQIATSPEHLQRFHVTEAGEGTPYERSVARLYRHILGRQPDAAGQRTHAELAQRRGGAAVVDALIDSEEYGQQFGDWGVPGSGGVRYCPPGTRVSRDTGTGTSGQRILVDATERWTDTGIDVRAGDALTFDARGTVRLSDNGSDTAGTGGTLSGRRAASAPLRNQSVGALIARIDNGRPLFVGDQRSLLAPATGRLYLGVNDASLADNRGTFQVSVTNQGR